MRVVRARLLRISPIDASSPPGKMYFSIQSGVRRHAAAVMGRRPDGEAAPPGTDLEHLVAGHELELAADAIDLLLLRRLQRVGRAPVEAARVHQVARVEEQAEEIVAEIVMAMDVR